MYKLLSEIMYENNNKINDLGKRLTVKLNLKGIQERDKKTIEKIGATRQYERKSGDFIYGKQNFHKGCFAIIPSEYNNYVSSSDIPSFTFYKGFVPHYCYYFLSRENLYKAFENKMTGTGSKRLNQDSFLKYNILIPNENEQQKIAQFFSLLDHHIKLWERKLELYQLKKKYYLDKMFADKDIPELRFNQFFENLNLNKIENLVLSMKSGGTPLSTKKEYYNGNINFLTISDMDDKYIYKTDKFISKEGLDNSSSYTLSKNNLLISIYASLGKISINKIDVALPQSIVGVIIDNSKLNLEFIYQYLIYKNKWFKLNAQIGSQPNINIETLKKMNIFFPELNEQQKIASFFEQNDKFINLCRFNIQKLKDRKKYYLNNLFI